MKLFKFVAVICTIVFSKNLFSMGDANKEPEITPLEITATSGYMAQSITDPVQIREEGYQKILAELERIKSHNPESENHEVSIIVLPQFPTDSAIAYDLLMEVMKNMPAGSSSGFEYFIDDTMVATKVNQAGLEYLYSLGTVNLVLDKVEFFN